MIRYFPLAILSVALSACVEKAPAQQREQSQPAAETSAPSTPAPGAGVRRPVPPTAKPAPQPPARAQKPFTVTLERTFCEGPCPVYKLSIDHLGAVTFEGQRFVGTLGAHRATADRAAVDQLRQLIEDTDIATLNNCYCDEPITDMATTIVTIDWNGQKKRIEHYGGDDSAPERLLTLQKKIDELSGSKRWIDAPKT